MLVAYQNEKWYWEKVQEELAWEDQVRQELEEGAAAEAASEPAAAD
jgi:hypothetical protein